MSVEYHHAPAVYGDFIKEIEIPWKKGYYLEVIVRLDAAIDVQLWVLSRIVTDKNSKIENNRLKHLKDIELFEKQQNIRIFSEQFKELPGRIRKFKRQRNQVVHSTFGHYQLIAEKNFKDDKEFQKEAKAEADRAIEYGIESYRLLVELTRNETEKWQKQFMRNHKELFPEK